jgi:hypothetical protein
MDANPLHDGNKHLLTGATNLRDSANDMRARATYQRRLADWLDSQAAYLDDVATRLEKVSAPTFDPVGNPAQLTAPPKVAPPVQDESKKTEISGETLASIERELSEEAETEQRQAA